MSIIFVNELGNNRQELIHKLVQLFSKFIMLYYTFRNLQVCLVLCSSSMLFCIIFLFSIVTAIKKRVKMELTLMIWLRQIMTPLESMLKTTENALRESSSAVLADQGRLEP